MLPEVDLRSGAVRSRPKTPFTFSSIAKRLVTVDAIAVAVVVFGPLVGIAWLLLKSIRKLMPRPIEAPLWRRRIDEPRGGGDPAGDREPRRPLVPSWSGGIALALPADDATEADQPPARRLDRPPEPGDPGGRLAG